MTDVPVLTALNLILQQLCTLNATMRDCCKKDDCMPGKTPSAGALVRTVALSTSPTRVLGNNPARKLFIIGNTLNTQKIFAAPRGGLSASGGGTVVTAANSAKSITQYEYPSSVQGEWFLWADSGTPTVSIQEELAYGGS